MFIFNTYEVSVSLSVMKWWILLPLLFKNEFPLIKIIRYLDTYHLPFCWRKKYYLQVLLNMGVIFRSLHWSFTVIDKVYIMYFCHCVRAVYIFSEIVRIIRTCRSQKIPLLKRMKELQVSFFIAARVVHFLKQKKIRSNLPNVLKFGIHFRRKEVTGMFSSVNRTEFLHLTVYMSGF